MYNFGGENSLSAETIEIAHQYHAKFRKQIVGGADAGAMQFPYVVLVKINDQPMCVGTIMNKVWVLTSALCTFGTSFASDDISIVAGLHNINDMTNAQEREVDFWMAPTVFDGTSSLGAVALLHLTWELEWNDYVTVSPPIASAAPAVGTTVTTMGWGSISAGLPYTRNTLDPLRFQNKQLNMTYTIIDPTVLQTADFTVIDILDAEAIMATFFGTNRILGPKHIYFNSMPAGKGTCSFLDDGAPLISQDGSWLLGTVAWRLACAHTVDIAVEHAAFKNWIEGGRYPEPITANPNFQVTPYPWPAVNATVKVILGFKTGDSDLGNKWKIEFPPDYIINAQMIWTGKYLPTPDSWSIDGNSIWFVWDPLQAAPTFPIDKQLWFTVPDIETTARCEKTDWTIRTYECQNATDCMEKDTKFTATLKKPTANCNAWESAATQTIFPDPWTVGNAAAPDTFTPADDEKFGRAIANLVNTDASFMNVMYTNVKIISKEAGSAIIKWRLINIDPTANGGDANAMLDLLSTGTTVSAANAAMVAENVGSASGPNPLTTFLTFENEAPEVVYSGAAEVIDEDNTLSGLQFPMIIEDEIGVATQIFVVTLVLSGPGNMYVNGFTPTGSSTGPITLTYDLQLGDMSNFFSGLVYEPPANWHGTVYVLVTVDDQGLPNTQTGGAMTASTTIPIVVNAVNDAPEITLGAASYNTDEEVAVVFSFTVADNDLSATDIIEFTIDAGDNGTLADGATPCGADCTILMQTASMIKVEGTLNGLHPYVSDLVFTPGPHLNDWLAVTVWVDDRGIYPAPAIKSLAYVWFNVKPLNDPIWFAQTDYWISGDEDTWIALPSIMLSDPDRNGAAQLNISTPMGWLQLDTDASVTTRSIMVGDGYLYSLWGPRDKLNWILSTAQYKGNQDWNGQDLISIWASDLGNYGEAAMNLVFKAETNVTVTVNPVNDPPVITAPTMVTTHRDENISISIMIDDVDVAAGILRVELNGPHGKLSFSKPAGVTVLVPASGDSWNADGQITFEGTLADINEALSTFTYMDDFPHRDFITHIEDDLHNKDWLTISVDDNGNTGSGSLNTAMHTVNITVTTDVYPTCHSFVTKHPQYCGCYYKVNHANSDSQSWITLPLNFPSNQFPYIEDAALPYKFAQGCCARKNAAVKDAELTDVAHLGVCSTGA
eukprot:TRINITY_DN66089_c8_g2_i1.p1 TRINITY_DN66089_c8_g2~~TRINITY_DN66089_c8_g2_i1.p1  ORF type:complete len:1218 (-),score=180.43 TRINITY_DN66089_c8_g2_i1:797-4318(-)